MKNKIVIYTDGACSGNPGKGGWGALVIFPDRNLKISGYEEHTTNNRMELFAAISSLNIIKAPSLIDLHTDSMYLKNGITSWINQWVVNSWRSKSNKTIKNVDLWKKLYTFNNFHSIDWIWVEGHSGNMGNETADQLARNEIIKHRNK